MIYEFTVTLPSDEKISCKTFPLKPYSEILAAKSKEEPTSHLFKSLIEEYTSSKDLSKHEAEYVLLHLLNHSLNEDTTPQAMKTCECGHEEIVSLNMSNLSIYINTPIEPIDFGKFKIKFKYPKIFEDNDIALMISNSIDKIIIGDEVISVNDLNDQEILDLYNAITTDHLIKIRDMLLNPTLQLAIPYKCPKCGKDDVFLIEGFDNILRLIL